jgi:peptidoglycan/LPS O-acetylase OafA/YrhL
MTQGIAANFQFVQQLFLFPTLYYFLKISKSPLILEWIMKSRHLNSSITLIGSMTLELYLVHGPLRMIAIQYFPPFPFNVLGLLVMIFILSYLLYRFNNKFINFLKKQIP